MILRYTAISHRISYSFPNTSNQSAGDTDDHVCHAAKAVCLMRPGRILLTHPCLEQDEANAAVQRSEICTAGSGDIMWQVEFFADEGEDGEICRQAKAAAQSVLDGDYDDRDPPNGRKRILCMKCAG